MRKALVVGINFYSKIPGLYGCVNDAYAVKDVLETNSDGSVNFGVLTLAATNEASAVDRSILKDRIIDLFADDSDIALLFFAGHGHIESTGGYLCGSDCARGDDGLPLTEVITLANKSPAKNKIVVLDSCHSGIAGTPFGQAAAELTEGISILTASTKDQYATEENGSGVFTTLFVDALNGAASNLVGDVTPGSIYAHIDQSLGPWRQRPVFKTNIKSFVSLRTVQPPISLADLLQLTTHFPKAGFIFDLDPSFEPELTGRPDGAVPPNPENSAIFAVLQKWNRINLLVPIDAPHMWHAAIESKSCRLTALGEHYRRLVEQKLL